MSRGAEGVSVGGRPWKVVAGAVLVCAALDAYALADRSLGEPSNADIRRYVLGELYDGHRVEQRFRVKAHRFSSITIYPRPASPSPTGTAVLQLSDVSNEAAPIVIKRVEEPVAALVQSRSYTIEFPAQPSAYRDYVLEVTVEGSSDGQGLGLLATRGEGYRGGKLWLNGRERVGDLAFETTVAQARSAFRSMASQLAQTGVPAPAVVLVLVLLGKYAALFFVIRALVPEGAAAAPQALPAQSPPA